jgi:hypothetical protein
MKKETATKPSKKVTSESIRIRKDEYEMIDAIIKKANNKSIGKKIVPSDLLAILLKNASDNQIKQLQLSSVRHTDRKKLYRKIYVEKYGATTDDEFEGFVMSSDFSKFKKENDKKIESHVLKLVSSSSENKAKS